MKDKSSDDASDKDDGDEKKDDDKNSKTIAVSCTKSFEWKKYNL